MIHLAGQQTLFGGADIPHMVWCYIGTDLYNLKIGHSLDVRRRGGELKIHRLCRFPGGELTERRLIKSFGDCRMPGNREWFRTLPKLVHFVAGNIRADDAQAWAAFQQLLRHNGMTWTPKAALPIPAPGAPHPGSARR